jgi:hypothetical protein
MTYHPTIWAIRGWKTQQIIISCQIGEVMQVDMLSKLREDLSNANMQEKVDDTIEQLG